VTLCDIKYTPCNLEPVLRVQIRSHRERLSRDSASFLIVMGSHVLKLTRNLQEDINAPVGDI
jgi:hypothetical protein